MLSEAGKAARGVCWPADVVYLGCMVANRVVFVQVAHNCIEVSVA